MTKNKGIEFLEKLSKLMNEYNGSIELFSSDLGNSVGMDIDVENTGEFNYTYSFESSFIDENSILNKIKEMKYLEN